MSSLLLALDQELGRFIQFVKSNKAEKETAKCVSSLHLIWNNYEPKISKDIFAEKCIAIGDFLASQQCYKVGAHQCYGRFLHTIFGNINLISLKDENVFFNHFKELADPNTILYILRAVVGYTTSLCYSVISQDQFFQNSDTCAMVVSLLKVLQLTMQKSLEKDTHCWIVYNSSIHMYSICRKLLSHGLTTHILEYLLWCCICMESSVPLMTIKYLSWRVQLYTAVCQSYYDMKADVQAEEFAKRGINKIAELQEIEKISTACETPFSIYSFKQARIKMSVMVFKRHVFESRRRPKGVLRPKLKPLLKDIVHNPWPRTGTERFLADLFQGRSAQFLAIIETLTNSNRRLIQTSHGAPESDDCLHEVYLELFFAGLEIVSGGGGIKPCLPGKNTKALDDVIDGIALIELACHESQSISILSLVKFVKLSYNYENWEVFDVLVTPTIEELKKYTDNVNYDQEMKILQLLQALCTVNSSRVKKKFVLMKADDTNDSIHMQKSYKAAHIDELSALALLLDTYLNNNDTKLFVSCHTDALIDIVLLLWKKCKNHFSRISNDQLDSHKAVYVDPLFSKWLRILIITHRSMVKVNIHLIDASTLAEASLKLCMVLKCILNGGYQHSTLTSANNKKQSDVESLQTILANQLKDVSEFLNIPNEKFPIFQFIYNFLEECLLYMNKSRDLQATDAYISDESLLEAIEKTKDMYMLNLHAIHLEVLYQHHYIHAMIDYLHKVAGKESTTKKSSLQLRQDKKANKNQSSVCSLLEAAGQNNLSKALYLISSVDVKKSNSKQALNDLNEACTLLNKVSKSEEKLRNDNQNKLKSTNSHPPPPILLHRGSSLLILKPGSFQHNDEVHWVTLHVRNAAGNNVKVRLGDTKYKGTGILVPYNEDCVLKVEGLKCDERYVVAIAAYTKDHQLIGGSIGSTSRPILASHPLPLALAYSFLAKVAYEKDDFKVSKLASNILWNYFVQTINKQVDGTKTANHDYELSQLEIIDLHLKNSSMILHRHFIQTIFISVDIGTKEASLYCDMLCDGGPVVKSQMKRLEMCQMLIIALKVCGWLNDNVLALQACVLIYGLLAPIIYWRLPVQPVLQVLIYILSVLQEIQSIFKNRRQNPTTESLQHMITCITTFTAKLLVQFGKKSEASQILESGSKLLSQLVCPDSAATTITLAHVDGNSSSAAKRHATKRNKKKKGGGVMKAISDFSSISSSELYSLEAFAAKLLNQAPNDNEFELTGTEDPMALNAVIAHLSPAHAYKEVVKFKRRTQYMEYFVGVISKAFHERSYDQIIEWSKESINWITRRNEILLNKSTAGVKGIIVVASNLEDEKLKKFSTGVVEYGRSSLAFDLQNSPRKSIAIEPQNSTRKSIAIEQQNSTRKSITIEPQNSTRKSIAIDSQSSGKKSLTVEGIDSGRKSLVESTVSGASGKHLSSEIDVKSSKIISPVKSNMKKINILTHEEKKIKDASVKIQLLLPEIWRSMQRRKKMRNVSKEELPWRAQINVINGETHFNISLDKFNLFCKRLGYANLHFDESYLDTDLFTLENSGTIFVSWAASMKSVPSNHDSNKKIDIGGKTFDHGIGVRPSIHLVPTPSRQSLSIKMEKKLVNIVQEAVSELSTKQDESKKAFIVNFEQAMLCYQRALVLCHRGKTWILLQQVANKLLTSCHMIIMKIVLLNTKLDTSRYSYPYDLVKLRSLLWKPFYFAAEFLLDSLTEFQERDTTNVESTSLFGDITNNQGGSNLNFDEYFDNNSYIDYAKIKKVIMFAIEILYYEEKWETVISIIMRFNALSRNHFSESLLPLLMICQRSLHNRLHGIKQSSLSHPEIIFDKNTGVPIEIHLVPVTPLPIEVGAHIDPAGHKLYEGAIDGIKYSIVSTKYEETAERFYDVMDVKPYSSRMLEHSRRLMTAYLAGKYADLLNEGKIQEGTSQVSFVANQVKPLSYDPSNVQMSSFKSFEDIEMFPILENQLAVIITAYDRTIEMLMNSQQKGLVSQAMHELGNILYHMGNLKGALKQWTLAIECILQQEKVSERWREFLLRRDDELAGVQRYSKLLERCGMYGCLLAGLLATKIARYIYHSSLKQCNNMVQLASALFKAVFCSSLGHPSAEHSYASYEISSNNRMQYILPGLNLFADQHRLNASSLMATLVWLCKYLIKRGFYVEVQPLLTFSQYLANTICKSLQYAVQIKLLRVESLCQLNKFSLAFKYFQDICTGVTLPSPADILRNKYNQKFSSFCDSKHFSDHENIASLSTLCNFKFVAMHQNVYGKVLCRMIAHAHSLLLIQLASVIKVLPSDAGCEVSDSITQATSAPTLNESTSDVLKKSKEKLPTINERRNEGCLGVYATDADRKHLLLKTARQIINPILENSLSDKEQVPFSSEDMESYIESHHQLSQISYQESHVMTSLNHLHTCLEGIHKTLDVVENDEGEIQYKSSDGGIDPTLWLFLRNTECERLLQEDNAVGRLAGHPYTVVNKTGTFEQTVKQTKKECKMFNEYEMVCYVEFYEIKVLMESGENVNKILEKLQNLIAKLKSFECLSHPMKSLLYEIMLLTCDLRSLKSTDRINASKEYEQIEIFLLDQIVFNGTDIHTTDQYPVASSFNIYDELIAKLISVKTRRFRCDALTFSESPAEDSILKWKNLLNKVDRALSYSDKLSNKNVFNTIELNFLKGEITRILFEVDSFDMNECIQCFLRVIMLSTSFTHDLNLIRRCYMEMALVFNIAVKRKGNVQVFLTKDTSPKNRRKGSVQSPTKSLKVATADKALFKELQNLNKASWVSIRAAGVIAKAQRKIELLAGEASITSLKIGGESLKNLPPFAIEDLLCIDDSVTYSLHEDGSIQLGDGIEEQIKSASNKVELSWVHLLHYLTHLRRHCNYSGLAIGSEHVPNVRIPIDCYGKALKLNKIITYLSTYLNIFEKECSPILPVDIIDTALAAIAGKNDRATVSPFEMLEEEASEMAENNDSRPPSKATSPRDKLVSPEKTGDRSDRIHVRNPIHASDYELAMQWYTPDIQLVNTENINLLVSMNTKSIAGNSPISQFAQTACVYHFEVSKQLCFQLYNSIKDYVQITEASQAAQGNSNRSAVAFTAVQAISVSKSSVQTRKKTLATIKPYVPSNNNNKVEKEIKDENHDVKNKFALFFERFQELLNLEGVGGREAKIPVEQLLDGNWSNVVCFEYMLNPSLGHISKLSESMFAWYQQTLSKSRDMDGKSTV